jgi:hypothetical protein
MEGSVDANLEPLRRCWEELQASDEAKALLEELGVEDLADFNDLKDEHEELEKVAQHIKKKVHQNKFRKHFKLEAKLAGGASTPSCTFQVEAPYGRIFTVVLSSKQTVAELRCGVMNELMCTAVTLLQHGKTLEDSQPLTELPTDEVSYALLTALMSPLTMHYNRRWCTHLSACPWKIQLNSQMWSQRPALYHLVLLQDRPVQRDGMRCQSASLSTARIFTLASVLDREHLVLCTKGGIWISLLLPRSTSSSVQLEWNSTTFLNALRRCITSCHAWKER